MNYPCQQKKKSFTTKGHLQLSTYEQNLNQTHSLKSQVTVASEYIGLQ